MTLAPMGGGAPAAALVVAAAALPSSPHIGVRAARGIRSRALLAFAPCPPACPRWRRWRRGRGAKGCAPVAAGSLRPPCCRLRPSFAGSGGGWSLGGALAIKKGANVARVPSLPARRRARARVRLRGKQRWGGLLAPSGGCAAAAPPPPPPVKCWGRGLWLSCVRCGGVAPAAAGAKKTAPCGAVLKETQYMVLALLDGGLLALPLGDAERAGQSAYAARRVQGVVVAKVQHRNILTQ